MYDELGVKPLIVGHYIGFALRNRIFFLGGGERYQRTFHSDILQKLSFLCVMLYSFLNLTGDMLN